MEGTAVFRLISLIPDRAARCQTGSLFQADGSAKMDLLCRFLHWMGPLNALTREEQQLLGVRATGARSLLDGLDGEAEGEEGLDAMDLAGDLDEVPVKSAEAGTQIAA